MLSWLRCFPHDAMERKHSTKARRSASTCTATSYNCRDNESSSNAAAAARIIRCSTAAASARASFGRECCGHGDDVNDSAEVGPDRGSSSSPPPPAAYNHSVISARVFSFRELAAATGNFRQDNLIGEGGFGRVYKGLIHSSTGEQQAVAVKQLDRNGLQGNREFLVEVLVLTGLLHHPNLVDLLGYCAEGNQRLLVYHLMPLGSLEDHLLDHRTTNKPPLPWRTRMKIAHGAAKGLEYLHETASPPVIYRDLKSSNILLDEGYNPRLSDFGLAMLLAPTTTTTCNRNADQDESSSSSRAMGTYGYCAPEYVRTGHLTVKSDVYSFGVVLLELITGRRAIDTTRPEGEQNLVGWAAPMFGDQKRFHELVDPLLLLQGEGDGYRPCNKDLNQAVAVAAMCLQEDDSVRPIMTDVVTALSFLAKDT